MAQYDINLREYWRVVKKRKPIVILTVILLTAFSVTLTKLRAPTPLYESACSVKFEKAISPVGIYTQFLSWGPGDMIQTQMAVIKGYPVFTKVAKALGRIDKAEKPTPAVGRIISELQSQVQVKREAESNIVNITATAGKPAFAAQLANQVALAYKQTRAEEINQRIAEAIKFIEGQLTIVGERLKRSEERLQEFRRKRDVIAINSQSSNLLSRAYSLETRLSDTLEAKIELEAVMERIQGASSRPLSSERSFSSDKASPLYQKLNTKLVDLMLERDSLLIQYTSSHPKVVELSAQVSEIARKMIIELESQLNTLAQREESLRKEIALISTQVEALPVKGLELARLERDVERTSQVYSLLETKHQEALIQNAEKPDEVIIVRPAFEPTSPINRPNMTSSGLLGSLIGLVLGLVFAFIIETLDTSLGAIGDVEQTLGLPVVGLIPHVESKDGRPPLIPYLGSHSVLAESFRSLRTTLQFSVLEKDIKSMVITSASPLEGKSVVAANLAIAMAQGGLKTVLLSTDLRKPMLYKLFGIKGSPGVSDLLLGSSDASQAIRTVTDLLMGEMGVDDIMLTPGIDNLHIITCGKISSNPGELIESDKLKELLDALNNNYDVVLMDTPPLIFAADASILAMKSDGVLLVYRAGEVGRGILKRIKDQLEQVKANIIGVVLNGVKAEISPDFEVVSHYKYYHYYGYGDETKKTRTKEKRRRHNKSRRLLLLCMALLLPIGVLLWQTGILHIQGYEFKAKALAEQSAVALLAATPLKLERTQGDFFYPKVSDPPPVPVHYPYSVMTGSFKTLEQADKQTRHLKNKGLEPFWTRVDLGEDGICFRVCVGYFETARAAQEFKERFDFKEGRIIKTAYANKIGNFASRDEVEKAVASLREAGHSPYVIQGPQDGCQVFIGAYIAKKSALDAASRLTRAGIDNSVVLR